MKKSSDNVKILRTTFKKFNIAKEIEKEHRIIQFTSDIAQELIERNRNSYSRTLN